MCTTCAPHARGARRGRTPGRPSDGAGGILAGQRQGRAGQGTRGRGTGQGKRQSGGATGQVKLGRSSPSRGRSGGGQDKGPSRQVHDREGQASSHKRENGENRSRRRALGRAFGAPLERGVERGAGAAAAAREERAGRVPPGPPRPDFLVSPKLGLKAIFSSKKALQKSWLAAKRRSHRAVESSSKKRRFWHFLAVSDQCFSHRFRLRNTTVRSFLTTFFPNLYWIVKNRPYYGD